MNPLEPLLLILILFSGEESQTSAFALAEHLADIGQDGIQVAIGDDADAILAGKGIGIEDLAVSPQIGQQLTRDAAMAIVRLRVEDAGGGDQLLEGRIWSAGRIESHTTIVGADIDPVPIFARGVWTLLARSLRRQEDGSPQADDPQAPLVDLVRNQAWTRVLGRLAGTEDRSAREWYYMVLAYARLGQREPALETLRRMQAAHAGHILTTAAGELIPPPGPDDALPPDDSNVLRDDDQDAPSEQTDDDAERALRDVTDDDADDALRDLKP